MDSTPKILDINQQEDSISSKLGFSDSLFPFPEADEDAQQEDEIFINNCVQLDQILKSEVLQKTLKDIRTYRKTLLAMRKLGTILSGKFADCMAAMSQFSCLFENEKLPFFNHTTSNSNSNSVKEIFFGKEQQLLNKKLQPVVAWSTAIKSPMKHYGFGMKQLQDRIKEALTLAENTSKIRDKCRNIRGNIARAEAKNKSSIRKQNQLNLKEWHFDSQFRKLVLLQEQIEQDAYDIFTQVDQFIAKTKFEYYQLIAQSFGNTQETLGINFSQIEQEIAKFKTNLDANGPTNWKTVSASLLSVLQDAVGMPYFQQFCEKEFCTENLYFVQAIKQFRDRFSGSFPDCDDDDEDEDEDEVVNSQPLEKSCSITSTSSNSSSTTKQIQAAEGADKFLQLMNKQIADRVAMKSQAQSIFNRFFLSSGEHEINIAADVHSVVSKAMKNGDFSPNMFDDADQAIFQLMDTDTWPRFCKSSLFKTMIERLQRRTYNIASKFAFARQVVEQGPSEPSTSSTNSHKSTPRPKQSLRNNTMTSGGMGPIATPTQMQKLFEQIKSPETKKTLFSKTKSSVDFNDSGDELSTLGLSEADFSTEGDSALDDILKSNIKPKQNQTNSRLSLKKGGASLRRMSIKGISMARSTKNSLAQTGREKSQNILRRLSSAHIFQKSARTKRSRPDSSAPGQMPTSHEGFNNENVLPPSSRTRRNAGEFKPVGKRTDIVGDSQKKPISKDPFAFANPENQQSQDKSNEENEQVDSFAEMLSQFHQVEDEEEDDSGANQFDDSAFSSSSSVSAANSSSFGGFETFKSSPPKRRRLGIRNV